MSYSPFALLLKNKPKFKSGTMILQSEFRIFSKQPLRTNPTKEETISFNRSNPGKQLFSLQRWQLCKCVLNCNGHLIMTPNYANLFIHLLEQYFIYNSPTEPKTWQRQEASFRDDYLIFEIPTQLIPMNWDNLGWALLVGGSAFLSVTLGYQRVSRCDCGSS